MYFSVINFKIETFTPTTMKLFLFITLFSFSFSSFSQVWVDQGAVWHYDVHLNGLQGFTKYEYVSDSTLQGESCQVITAYQHQVYPGPNNTYNHSNMVMDTNFTYTNGDTVFWLVENEFKVLYNFGAQVGDSWTIANADPAVECLDAIVEVDSIGTIQLNGDNLRWIAFHSQDNSSYIFKGKAVERFGVFELTPNSPHALFPVKHDCSEGVFVDYYLYDFTCFEDASFNLFNVTSQDCEYKASLSLNDLSYETNGVTFYMNQLENLLYLSNSKNSNGINCAIINSLGQQVMNEKPLFQHSNSETIDVSSFNPGIYFLSINKDGFVQSKRFLITD